MTIISTKKLFLRNGGLPRPCMTVVMRIHAKYMPIELQMYDNYTYEKTLSQERWTAEALV